MNRLLAFLIGAVSAAAAAPAAAETRMLKCATPGEIWLLTIDTSARRMTADWLNPDGSITRTAFQQLPAQFSDEYIDATWRNGSHYRRFRLNRYSLVLGVDSFFGVNTGSVLTQPCEPFQRRQQRI